MTDYRNERDFISAVNRIADAIEHLARAVEENKRQEQTPINFANSWPSATNCKRNCKICHAKCMYRKEAYVD